MALTIGDRVGELTLARPDGSAVSLYAFGVPLLMIFLRHLA
jgi:hypothetical protein